MKILIAFVTILFVSCSTNSKAKQLFKIDEFPEINHKTKVFVMATNNVHVANYSEYFNRKFGDENGFSIESSMLMNNILEDDVNCVYDKDLHYKSMVALTRNPQSFNLWLKDNLSSQFSHVVVLDDVVIDELTEEKWNGMGVDPAAPHFGGTGGSYEKNTMMISGAFRLIDLSTGAEISSSTSTGFEDSFFTRVALDNMLELGLESLFNK